MDEQPPIDDAFFAMQNLKISPRNLLQDSGEIGIIDKTRVSIPTNEASTATCLPGWTTITSGTSSPRP